MRNFILILIVTIFSLNSTLADPPPRRDTIGFAWQGLLLHAPVITGGTQPIIILPNREPFCFDKQISVKMALGSSVVNKCLYLDTKGGLVGHLKPQRSAGGDLCDIKPEDKNFSFFIVGLKGNAYHYYNREDRGQIKNYVSTGNTDEYKLQIPSNPGVTVVLHVKTETRMYCDGKIKGQAYKMDGSNSVYFLFGREFPPALTWKKYIGNFGVGYLYTDKGLYMIMEWDAGNTSFKINSAEDVHVCFDPTQFHITEEEFVTHQSESLQKERDLLARDEAKLSQQNCQGERSAVLQYRRQILDKEELNLRNSQLGNMYQDRTAQAAMIDLMNPSVMVHIDILETKVNICSARENASKHPDDYSIPERISCLQELQGRLEACESQMQALDIQYASNMAQATAEKSRLLMRVSAHGCE